ncbi:MULTISPECIES: class I SAM-dependent methyltransferase [unclassified Myxococcus]|uniref:class I SAM-dependent methyltransferase n=1 Tax=Myxococcus TaxID=32 RepID=UPI001142D4B5|nr:MULTISPECIES: class I SAM-dependent methyltransferase [unclassified Myxococcus]NOK00933.1 class I SAM-dependent methyltransferase [Myxococcus xanthus]
MKKTLVQVQAAVTRSVGIVIHKVVPSFRLAVARFQYNMASKMYSHQGYKFINCGYADMEGDHKAVDFNRPENVYVLWESLYQRVVGQAELAGREVLEVGCGRGGGSEYLMTRLKPRSLTAVDLSDVAIARCKENYRLDGLSFQVGNACALPFEDRRFDVVVNIESSHCYPSQLTFFEEVKRVLKPGGAFCFADITESAEHTARINEEFKALGFTVVHHENITANVVKALNVVKETPQFTEAFERWESPNKKGNMKVPLMVINGTLKDLNSGKEYQRWVVRREEATERPVAGEQARAAAAMA